MIFNTVITSFALMASLVAAAPATSNATTSVSFLKFGQPTVNVVNNCGATLKVGNSVDVDYFGDVVEVSAGSTHSYTLPVNWSGRIWGRTNCGGENCFKSGMGSPASLAEFHFLDTGAVYYDISLVAGFNLPMTVAPVLKEGLTVKDSRSCATSICSTLPSCPSGFETYDDEGKVSGCKSACTKFNTDEYCCTGDFYNPNVCSTNSYASEVKATCPDAYSYAFDDATSVFICASNEYTVTFC
ncbi:thaumatin [Parasitella parasitica]|nr:thaumatin [Parasitella parasitica]